MVRHCAEFTITLVQSAEAFCVMLTLSQKWHADHWKVQLTDD